MNIRQLKEKAGYFEIGSVLMLNDRVGGIVKDG